MSDRLVNDCMELLDGALTELDALRTGPHDDPPATALDCHFRRQYRAKELGHAVAHARRLLAKHEGEVRP